MDMLSKMKAARLVTGPDQNDCRGVEMAVTEHTPQNPEASTWAPASTCPACGRPASRGTAWRDGGISHATYVCHDGHAWIVKWQAGVTEAQLRPLAHNVTIQIEHHDPEGPITTLGALRAAISGLTDDTPVWAMIHDQHEFFEGLQIGGER